MPLDRHSASARLGRQMQAAERSISASLIETSALLHSAVIAQADVGGVPVAQSHAALMRLNRMITGLLSVQGDAARAHGQMLDIHRELAGPEEPTECPDEVFRTAELNEMSA